jgi:hypothetical protein
MDVEKLKGMKYLATYQRGYFNTLFKRLAAVVGSAAFEAAFKYFVPR